MHSAVLMVTPARPDSLRTAPDSGPVGPPPRRGCWRTLRNLGLVVLLLLTAAILWGWMLSRADERAARVHASLMRDYFAAIGSGQWQRAWQEFTTAAYRQRFPFGTWQAAQAARRWRPASQIAPPGKLAARLIVGGVSVKYYDLLQGEPGQNIPVVYYEIIETPAGPRIDASYRLGFRPFTSKSGQRSSESVLLPEAW